MRTIFFMIAFLAFTLIHAQPKPPFNLPKEYKKVPAGTLVIKTDSTLRIAVDEFYISAYEISNLQYRTFCEEESANTDRVELKKIEPDTTGWELLQRNTEPLKRLYFITPSFNEYPVVNISHYAATRYCAWLEEKLKNINPLYEVTVRLPTKAEWIWAAQGGRSQAMFPWTNYLLHNKKGQPLCNFKTVNDRNIYRNRKTGKPEVAEANSVTAMKFTSVVNSYKKNEFGLFNMCGNVAEMISEDGISLGGSWNDFGGDVHIRAESKFERPSPMAGFRPVITMKRIE